MAGSWVKYDSNCDFPIENLPYGVFHTGNPHDARIGVAIGDFILDLRACASAGFFKDAVHFKVEHLCESTLNKFMESGRPAWTELRRRLQSLLSTKCTEWTKDDEARCLVLQSDATMLMPCRIGDYTDFYSSRYHATNVGIMFRGVENALQPNWLNLPVGYHGRASSVVVSGTPVRRPTGQLRPDLKKPPIHGPCRLLDFELEMGFFVGGKPNPMGEPINIKEAKDRIFGLCLMNDWSARDIQKWEYVPLGPFNGKNFATTISPWIVTLDALEPFRMGPEQPQVNPTPLPYLRDPHLSTYDINLAVEIWPKKSYEPTIVCKTNCRNLYWSFTQQLTHHSSTGCPFNAGDLCGSGTISGPERGSFGSMLEICWKGTKPFTMNDGSIRKYLQDTDTVNMTGYCQGDGYRIGFGPCSGEILPPISKL